MVGVKWRVYVHTQVLSQLITELKHDIPCATLTDMKTVADAYNYFQKEVKVTTCIDEMAKIRLPPNLNIQLEPIRFDANRDTFFGGISALPGQDGIVTSIKYSRKFKSIINSKPKPGYANYYYDDYRE